jgi:hypothetical protein
VQLLHAEAYRITPVKNYPASTFAKTFCSLEGEFIKFAQIKLFAGTYL